MPREYQYEFELRHLVYFREVARHLHFRRAAETLAVAQPALSRQVAQLEAALGLPLFTRTRRRVVSVRPPGAVAVRDPVPDRQGKLPIAVPAPRTIVEGLDIDS